MKDINVKICDFMGKVAPKNYNFEKEYTMLCNFIIIRD